MAKHKFKVTIEHVADQKNNPVAAPPLVFETANHDDIVEMAGKFATDDGQRSFLVGLKLFSEALLEDRDNPLYGDFLPHFGAFMKRLKASRNGRP